jgi:hypothetical protein
MPHAGDVEDPPPLSRSPTQLVAIFLVGGSAAGLPRPGALLLAGRSPPPRCSLDLHDAELSRWRPSAAPRCSL